MMEPIRVPAPAPAATLAAGELGDDDLEQVVGGLARIYVPGRVVAANP